MSNEIRAMWAQFDKLVESASGDDAKAIIAAIKLQTEFMNVRLVQIEMNTGHQARSEARKPS